MNGRRYRSIASGPTGPIAHLAIDGTRGHRASLSVRQSGASRSTIRLLGIDYEKDEELEGDVGEVAGGKEIRKEKGTLTVMLRDRV